MGTSDFWKATPALAVTPRAGVSLRAPTSLLLAGLGIHCAAVILVLTYCQSVALVLLPFKVANMSWLEKAPLSMQ
jgi:hypothetical protein